MARPNLTLVIPAILLLAFSLSSAPAGEPRTDLYGDPLPEHAIARMGTVRFHHERGPEGGFKGLRFAQNDRLLVSCSGPKICVFEAATGKVIYTVRSTVDHDNIDFAVSRDGQFLAETSDFGGKIRVRDLTTGKIVGMIGDTKYCRSMEFSPDHKILAVKFEGRIELHAWNEQKLLHTLKDPDPKEEIDSMAFSPDGKMIATGGRDPKIRLWDVAKGVEFRSWAGDELGNFQLIFSPDGKTLVSRNISLNIIFWDPASGKLLSKMVDDDPPVRRHDLFFSPDGKTLASGGLNDTIRMWDVASRKLLPPIGDDNGDDVNNGFVDRFAFSSDGKTVAMGDVEVIRIWDVATRKEVIPKDDDRFKVYTIDVSPDGRTLATAGDGGAIRLWEPTTGKKLRVLKGHTDDVIGITFAPDSRMLASASSDKTVRLWDAKTGKEIRQFSGHHAGVNGVAFSPDGRILTTGSADGTVRIWDVATGIERHSGKIPRCSVFRVAFSPNGKVFASLAYNENAKLNDGIRLWDAESGNAVRQFAGAEMKPGRMAFTPDGKAIITLGSLPSGVDVAMLLDVATGKEVRHFDLDDDAIPFAIAISPDSRTLATAERAGSISIWEIAAGERRLRFNGHRNMCLAVQFSPDGRTLFSGGYDTTALTWDLTGAAVAGSSRKSPTPSELQIFWSDLADSDATKAYQAVCQLQQAPKQSLPWIETHLSPVSRPDATHITHLIADLGSDKFAERDKASIELASLIDVTGLTMREAMKRSNSAEQRRRLAVLLEKATDDAPEMLRACRAVEVLDHIGTPEARRVLEAMAGGAAEARLTREAKATLVRRQWVSKSRE